VKTIDNVGRLRIAITRPIELPTFTSFPEFENDNMLALNCSNGGICEKPARRLSRTQNQFATKSSSEIDQALDIVNRGLVYIKDDYVPVVNLVMVQGPNSNLT
jgi:hypothetical protein